VSFKKQVNDGNFGSETAEVYIESYSGDDDGLVPMVRILNQHARAMVNEQLQASSSPRVRQGIMPPRARTPADADERVPF